MRYEIACHDAQIKAALGNRVVESTSGEFPAAELKTRVEAALPGVKVHVKVNESTGVVLVQRQLNG
jgi:hypothetical protein